MNKLILLSTLFMSFNVAAMCFSTKNDHGILYCAEIEDVSNDVVRLLRPKVISLYFSDTGAAVKTSEKRRLCRAFSKDYKYVAGSLVKGYAARRSQNNNQQARLSGSGKQLKVIYSVDCKIK